MRRLALSAIALTASLSAAPSGATEPAAATQQPAPSGDMTTPSDQTVVVTLPDGVAVTLEPGTKGRWMAKTKLPSETGKWAIGYHLVLLEGEADVRMPDDG